jgi:hypothetical protein
MPDGVQSLLHGKILTQRGNVLACDGQHWLMQVVCFTCHPATVIAQPGRRSRPLLGDGENTMPRGEAAAPDPSAFASALVFTTSCG